MNKMFALLMMSVLVASNAFADERREEIVVKDKSEQQVMFQCRLNDGMDVKFLRDARDVWELEIGRPGMAKVDIFKEGNSMNYAFNYHGSEATAVKEVYMTHGDWLYTIGVTDQGGNKTGHIQVMQAGVETAYSDCQKNTLIEKFDDDTAFLNMSTVD